MLGNDVVDLGDSEARDGASHPRFDARVFAPSERAALRASASGNRLRWSLWAAKEAAYKLGVKRAPGLVFSPSKFAVSLNDDGSGSVTHPAGTAHVTFSVAGDAIHAIAREDTRGEILAEVIDAQNEPRESLAVRELARERVAQRLGVALSSVRIGKRGRIPTLELRDASQAVARELDLSLSHHGRYLAFACEIDGASRWL